MIARESYALHTATPCAGSRDAAGARASGRAVGASEVLRHIEPRGDGGGRIAQARLRRGTALRRVSQVHRACPGLPAAEDGGPSPVRLSGEIEGRHGTVALAHRARRADPMSGRDGGRGGTVRGPFGVLWPVTSPPRAA